MSITYLFCLKKQELYMLVSQRKKVLKKLKNLHKNARQMANLPL